MKFWKQVAECEHYVILALVSDPHLCIWVWKNGNLSSIPSLLYGCDVEELLEFRKSYMACGVCGVEGHAG